MERELNMALKLTILIIAIIIIFLILWIFFPKKEFEQALLTFRFDDGYSSQLNASEILKKNNLTATFFCISDSVGENTYMDWDELKNLQENGFEIGSHTKTHKPMIFLSKKRHEQEIVESKQEFEKNNITTKVFAYPYGITNPFFANQVKENYDCASNYPFLLGVFNYANTDKYSLNCKEFKTAESFRESLDKAVEKKAWLVACFHRVGDEDGRYYVSEEEFEKMVLIAKEYQDKELIKVVDMSEGCSKLK